MSVDSFHHQVEQGMRQRKRVEDFQDFNKIVNNCGKSLLMSFNDFFKIPKRLFQAKYTCDKPKLGDAQVVKYVRGSAEMFWKTTSVEENFKPSSFFQRKLVKNIGKDFERSKENRGVKPAKKKDKIIEVLCTHIDTFGTNSTSMKRPLILLTITYFLKLPEQFSLNYFIIISSTYVKN